MIVFVNSDMKTFKLWYIMTVTFTPFQSLNSTIKPKIFSSQC